MDAYNITCAGNNAPFKHDEMLPAKETKTKW